MGVGLLGPGGGVCALVLSDQLCYVKEPVCVSQVLRLADCIRVSEVEMDGCPRDTGPFLIETTEKIYVFAADRQQLDDWTHKLCEIAFPVSPNTHTCSQLKVSFMLTSVSFIVTK